MYGRLYLKQEKIGLTESCPPLKPCTLRAIGCLFCLSLDLAWTFFRYQVVGGIVWHLHLLDYSMDGVGIRFAVNFYSPVHMTVL